MFNPKSNNLLDEQMSVSGLEMNWLPAVLSAGAAIAGGIMGAKERSSQNSANKKAEKKQKKFNKKIAKKTNKYNDKLDAADKANYYAMRDFSYKSSIKNWERGAEIQDYNYLQRLKEFQKSTAIGNANLGLNAQAAAMAYESERAAIDEAFIQQGFQHKQMMLDLTQTFAEANLNREEQGLKLEGIRSRQAYGSAALQSNIKNLMTQGALAKENEMVKSLISEGAAQASGQAGKSTEKRRQASKAALHRGLMALDSELSGKHKQAAIQLAELNADSSLAEAGVGLNLKRIDQAVENAQSEAKLNIDVMQANMKSAIGQAESNIKQIGFERSVADLNTRANMMLFPDRLSYDPVPELPPERIFVDRMKAIPGFVPPAQQQNVWAPLIQGTLQAGATIAGTDFSKPWHGR
jgi:hypothetical protein